MDACSTRQLILSYPILRSAIAYIDGNRIDWSELPTKVDQRVDWDVRRLDRREGQARVLIAGNADQYSFTQSAPRSEDWFPDLNSPFSFRLRLQEYGSTVLTTYFAGVLPVTGADRNASLAHGGHPYQHPCFMARYEKLHAIRCLRKMEAFIWRIWEIVSR